jgi:hypothetical protein
MTGGFAERWSPIRTGTALAGILIILFVIVEFAIGRFPDIPAGNRWEAWLAITHFVFLGGMVGSYMTAARLGRSSIEGLCATFPEDQGAQLKYIPPSRAHLLAFGLVGMILFGVVPPFLTADTPWFPSTWDPEIFWHRAMEPVIGLFTGMLLFISLRESLLVSRAAARIESVELFEPERFAPLVRHGLANGLVAVVMTSLLGLFLLAPDQGAAIGPVWGVVTPLMVLGIVLPVWGARSRLRQAKQGEMEWAMAGIREARAQDPVDSGRLGHLSAYYEIVRQAPEWPFTQSSYVRAASFVLLPALFWLVAVVVEGVVQGVVLRG